MTRRLRILIADDEAPARERLQRLVEELGECSVCAVCGSGLEAIEGIRAHAPDIALLDIRMPGMSGLEVARHLHVLPAPPAVVFTTAYDQYALEAFDSRAVGYLLKPVRRERLAEALKHAARLAAPALADLARAAEPLAERRHIAVRVRDDLKLIPVEEIRLFRSEQKYGAIDHDGDEYLLEESLRNLEEEFARLFVRIHRSLLVAVAEIDGLERRPDGTCWVRLRGSTEQLPVSRRQLQGLKERLSSGR
jgi:two-component system, LytTR family, response regulator AlgR